MSIFWIFISSDIILLAFNIYKDSCNAKTMPLNTKKFQQAWNAYNDIVIKLYNTSKLVEWNRQYIKRTNKKKLKCHFILGWLALKDNTCMWNSDCFNISLIFNKSISMFSKRFWDKPQFKA